VLDVVLIAPSLRPHVDFIDYPYHTDLGPVAGAAVLRAAGATVALCDTLALRESVVRRDGEHLWLGAELGPLLAQIPTAPLYVVALTPFHRPPARDNHLGELLLALRTRHPRALVLADFYQGTQHYLDSEGATVLAAYPEADVYLQYEAEGSLVELTRELASRGERDERRCVHGGEVAALDDLPLPAWDLVDLDARDALLARFVAASGRGAFAFPIDGRTLPVTSSRGCPYRCIHCSTHAGLLASGAKRQRRHGPAYLAKLVASLVGQYGATRLAFLDAMANVERSHFAALLDVLARAGVRADFPNGLRADGLDDALVATLAERIATLSLSAESGVQRVVDALIGKRQSLTQVQAAVEAAERHKLPCLVHFFIGTPGESRREINDTLAFATRLQLEHGATSALQFATPLPGTPLARLAPLPQRALDFGPHFQHEPLTASPEFSRADLSAWRWSFAQRQALAASGRKVIVNLTYRCNNHCLFCAVGNRSSVEASAPSVRRALHDYHAQGYRAVDFDGGEPTLHADLLELIRAARSLGYERVHVTSNGRRLCYAAYAQRLLAARPTTLLVSLHGADAVTHEALVGVPGAFAQTLDGIAHALRFATSDQEVGVNVTVTRENATQLVALAERVAGLGVRWLNLQFLTPFGRATRAHAPPLEPTVAQLRELVARFGTTLRLQVINLPFCYLPEHKELLVGDAGKRERDMVFVGDERVNLFAYLEQRRHFEPQCDDCTFRVLCGGFYTLEDEPEPPWTPQREPQRAGA